MAAEDITKIVYMLHGLAANMELTTEHHSKKKGCTKLLQTLKTNFQMQK